MACLESRQLMWLAFGAWILLLIGCLPAQAKTTAPNSADEARRRMDVEFFNEFSFRSEFPTEERVKKIKALAEAGFEIAGIAYELFNIERGGFPRGSKDHQRHYARLKSLAERGNPSAQCLYGSAILAYRQFHLSPATEADEKVVSPAMYAAAAKQRHPNCTVYAQDLQERTKENAEARFRSILSCARAGATQCQLRMSGIYSRGIFVEPNQVRALCWELNAKRANSLSSIENGIRNRRGNFRERDHMSPEEIDRLASKLERVPDCETLPDEPRRLIVE